MPKEAQRLVGGGDPALVGIEVEPLHAQHGGDRYDGQLRRAFEWLFGRRPHPDADLLPVIDVIADTLRVHLASARAQLPVPLQARLALLSSDLDRAMDQTIPDLPAPTRRR